MDLQKEREAFEQHLTDTGLVEFSDYGFAVDECDEYLHEPTQVAWDSWLIGMNRAKAQAVLEVKPSRCVTLTCAQLREAFMFGAPDKDDQEQLETEMTISWSENGHSGKGYYCYYSDLPEEGAIFLDGVIEAQEQTNDK